MPYPPLARPVPLGSHRRQMSEQVKAYPHELLVSEMKRVRFELARGNLENVDPDYYEALREEVNVRVISRVADRSLRRSEVRVSSYTRRRHYIEDRFGHRVYVGSEKWPSQNGLSKLRHHYKREHPRAFRASVRKGAETRSRQAFVRGLHKNFSKGQLRSRLGWTEKIEKDYLQGKSVARVASKPRRR